MDLEAQLPGGILNRSLSAWTRISHGLRKPIATITGSRPPSHTQSDQEPDPDNPGIELRELNSHGSGADVRPPEEAPQNEPPSLRNFPDELKINIIRFLAFGDIRRLRCTSSHWRDFASPDLMRRIHGAATFRTMLIQHCRFCVGDFPKDITRLYTTPEVQGYPMSSQCVTCAVQALKRVPGR